MANGDLVRNKASVAVVDYVLEELFQGRLKSGDRVDLDEVAETLGVSRLPVREAVATLERDGIVSTTYHRGVFIEPFDAQSILDDFEIMGLLSGAAVRRLARDPAAETLAALRSLIDDLRAVDPDDTQRTYQVVREILVIEHRAGGSRHLRAQLRTYAGFLPRAFDLIRGRTHEATVNAHNRVVGAIAAGDGERAARYRLEDFRDAGRRTVRELQRRGVLDGD